MGDADAYLAAIQIFFIGLGICAIAGAIFLAGRWQDVYWQHKQKRSLFKQDYFTLGFLSIDTKEITPFIVNVKSSVIKFKGNLWIAANNSIYRVSEAKLATDAKIETLKDGSLQITIKNPSIEDGFSINSSDTKAKQKSFMGLPTIFVSELSFKPVDFVLPNALRAGEVNAALDNYVATEFTQGKKPGEDIAIYLIAGTFILAGIAAYFGFQNTSALADLQKVVGGISGDMVQKITEMLARKG